jgi:TolB-like protein/Tfp pilus assembly protein PilF
MPRRLGAGLLAALLVLLGVPSLARWIRQSPKLESIAVLPLQNLSGDAQQEYLADGMTDAIIDELARVHSLRVISRTSAMAYKDARKPLPQIAGELAVDALMEGSIASDADHIQISARLIQAAGERTVWSKRLEAPRRNLRAVGGEIAGALTREMGVALTVEESARLSRKPAIDPEAYELYLKARYQAAQWKTESFANALGSVEKAIARQPDFAEAQAVLALTLANAALWGVVDPRTAEPRAKAAARRALDLDADLGQAHAALGAVLNLFDGNWKGAEKEFRRAVELAPGFMEAWFQLSLVTAGREDSVDAARRALALDPLTPTTNVQLGWALYFAGHFQDSIAQLRKVLELDPRSWVAHAEIAWNQLELGHKAEFSQTVDRLPSLIEPGKNMFEDTTTAALLAADGRRAEALALLAPWEERAKKEYVDPYQLATVRAQLGDTDGAVAWLQDALQKRSAQIWGLHLDVGKKAWLAPIRNDPRVVTMLRELVTR